MIIENLLIFFVLFILAFILQRLGQLLFFLQLFSPLLHMSNYIFILLKCPNIFSYDLYNFFFHPPVPQFSSILILYIYLIFTSLFFFSISLHHIDLLSLTFLVIIITSKLLMDLLLIENTI